MCLTLCVLVAVCAQEPRVLEAELFAAVGVAADADRAIAGRKWMPSRIAAGPAPALLRETFDAGVHASTRIEAAVRDFMADLAPMPAFLAAARAFGVSVAAPRRGSIADLRAFEGVLERAHREILQAIGSGRDPKLVAPTLHGLLDRALHVGGELEAEDIAALRDVGGRLAKVDHRALVQQAALVLAAVDALLEQEQRAALLRLPGSPGGGGVVGTVLLDRVLSFGRLVIGGPGPNEYASDQLAVILDLGGDDTYRGPAGGAGVHRRFSLVVDVAGNDRYEALHDGLGAATLGVGILLDLAGDDEYAAEARSAGFGAGGVGLLADLGGRDTWKLARDSGGVGCYGLGVLLDLGAENDTATVGPRCLGVGLPGGLGCYVDGGGGDRRDAQGASRDGLVAGVGVGLPPWLIGGVGLCLDVSGDDVYRLGDLSGGVGDAHGLGVLFDASGADQYAAGGFALGAARGGGAGFCFDAEGDDEYSLNAAPGLGAVIDGGLAWAEDRNGEDRYGLAGEGAGYAAGGGLGVFWDRRGRDTYTFRATARAPAAGEHRRAVALAFFADFGAGEDGYERTGTMRVAGNGRTERSSANAAHGEVVTVFTDR